LVDDTISGFGAGQSAFVWSSRILLRSALWLIVSKQVVAIRLPLAAGFLSFIPYRRLVSGLVYFDVRRDRQFWPDWTSILLVPATSYVGQFLADYVLAPLFGWSPQLHIINPVWVMFALFAFGYLSASWAF